MRKHGFLFVLGLILLYFSNGRYATAAAAWLFPIALLSVSRYPAVRHTYLWFPLAVGVTLQLAFWKFTSPDPASLFFYVPFVAGLVFGFLFHLDRLAVRHADTFGATLVFPLLYTSVDFVNGLLNPFGTTGVLGYSQAGFLPLAQLASLTGVWGITFVLTWVGSVVVWAWGKPLAHTRRGLLTAGVVVVGTLAYGTARLRLPLTNKTVRVAGLHRLDRQTDLPLFQQALAQRDTATVLRRSNRQLAELTALTTEQARRGAKIVVWSETSPFTLKSREAALLTHLQTVSRQLRIYLVACPYLATTNGTQAENKLWICSPQGKLVYTHYKYGGNFLEGTVAGNGQLSTIDTPHGRLAGIVCWDADFPAVVRQLGTLQADLVLHPAWDWREIDPLHTQVAVFRAIENGCSWVRQTQDGLSVIVDPCGRTLARMDHFETNRWVIADNVPTGRLRTLYPIWGDWFGWLSLLGLLAFVAGRVTFAPAKLTP